MLKAVFQELIALVVIALFTANLLAWAAILAR